MVWQPGQSGNPNGRPRKYPAVPDGIEPRYYYKQTALIKEEQQYTPDGDLILEDPVLFQHKLLGNESLPVHIRASIAAAIAPYCHLKLGLVSPPRFIEIPIEVPTSKPLQKPKTSSPTSPPGSPLQSWARSPPWTSACSSRTGSRPSTRP
jgi:hypothetical protein